MIRLLVIDNRDSFVYNIVQLLRQAQDLDYLVCREEDLVGRDLEGFDALLLSPGPGVPSDYPEMLRLADRALAQGLPLLGVCLGHQALAQLCGAQLYRLAQPLHGHASRLRQVASDPILGTEASGRIIGRYHSWAVDPASLPPELIATAYSYEEDQVAASNAAPVLMAIRHSQRPAFGLQFHPESMISQEGAGYLARFLDLVRTAQSERAATPTLLHPINPQA